MSKKAEESLSDEPLPMLQGKFTELKKMKRNDMETEITAWRNLWSYVPSEVKDCIAGVFSFIFHLPSLS
jgi:hypothetical protein